MEKAQMYRAIAAIEDIARAHRRAASVEGKRGEAKMWDAVSRKLWQAKKRLTEGGK